MDYSKLLKQDLIELLEQRSFADFIYKEEAEMRKILLKQNADKDEQIKELYKDLSLEQYLQVQSQRKINKLSETIIDIKDNHKKELDSIKNKLINAEKLIDRIEDLFEVFLDLCKDQESKDLLIKIIDRNSIQSIKKTNDDGFDDLDLDFDELDEEIDGFSASELEDVELDLLDDDDLDDDLDEDLDLDDDLDDLDVDFDELEDDPDINKYAEKVVDEAVEEVVEEASQQNNGISRVFFAKRK
ncbi:hypothetical protein [Vibrio atypicus]|uniref:hypothetical protein n=1 Tax=Vibrio atypicus TaxID=558271 RepID=UPI00135745A0|nr:hypothetical protein [Vibrio atypicus]